MMATGIVVSVVVLALLYWFLGALIAWETEDWRLRRPRHQIAVARAKAAERAAAIEQVRLDTIAKLHQAAQDQWFSGQ
jgi:hypothetical protein